MKHNKTESMPVNFTITHKERRKSAPGVWVRGILAEYGFTALVFAEHAKYPSYELSHSQISKLEVRSLKDGHIVFNWDRGLDLAAVDANVEVAVRFLCETIAKLLYG